VIVSGVPPYLLKTADNPEGVDASVFDGRVATSCVRLLWQSQSDHVGFSPSGLQLYHCFERFDFERVPWRMERHHNAPSIVVIIELV
jgi:hypothetical protein